MRPLLTFLFGSGWWVPWHLFILSSLIPLYFLLHWFWNFDPQGGPQGGEAMLAVLFLVLLMLLVASLIDGMLWTHAAGGTGFRAYLKSFGFIFGGWILLCVIAVNLSNLAASTSAPRSSRVAGTIGLGVTLLAVHVANLYALWRFRGR